MFDPIGRHEIKKIMHMKLKYTFTAWLFLFSTSVKAATDVPWEWTMVIVGTISAVIATVLARKNQKAEGVGLKILLAGLYFWIAVFAQTIVVALLYHYFK